MIRVKLWLLTPNFHGCPINYNLWRNKLVWDFVGKNLRRFINGLLISAQILQRSAYILLGRLSFLVINSCSWYFSFKGAHSRTGDGQVFSVSHVIKHPSFSMQHLRHDVAVLKLASPATLGGKINTICLPSHGSRVTPGTTCYVTGKVFVFRYIKRCFFNLVPSADWAYAVCNMFQLPAFMWRHYIPKKKKYQSFWSFSSTGCSSL